jgi:hypothetical protein
MPPKETTIQRLPIRPADVKTGSSSVSKNFSL